jgi:tripartite-type tricarboxylate transporter receptor subunit TctC
MYAPIRTPKPIVDKLAAAMAKVMREPNVMTRLADVGTEAVGSSSAELDTLTRQQFELYRGIVQNNKSLLGAQ